VKLKTQTKVNSKGTTNLKQNSDVSVYLIAWELRCNHQNWSIYCTN